MSLSSAFKTDPEKEVNGVPVEFPNAVDESGNVPTFIVGRASKSNKAYQAALTKAAAPYQRQLQLKVDVSTQLEKAFLEVFCATLLRGWNHVKLSDVTGDETQTGYADFSKQNAIALLTRLPDVYDFLQEQSNTAALYLEVTREENAKN